MQSHNEYTLEEKKNCFENNKIKVAVNYCFRSNIHEISRVEQNKIALITFDDKKCSIDRCNSVPWEYFPIS